MFKFARYCGIHSIFDRKPSTSREETKKKKQISDLYQFYLAKEKSISNIHSSVQQHKTDVTKILNKISSIFTFGIEKKKIKSVLAFKIFIQKKSDSDSD